ncbi:MAG: J domain-containing protein [Actinomycetota bacterium]|nr:J domain-containing protein [Actinomycetota bacterium]
MDPHAVLGLDSRASPDEAARAYRKLAKRHHPDRAGTEGERRMAELNVAYEMLRSSLRPSALATRPSASAQRAVAGGWLPDAMRRALGRELLSVLEPDEDVGLVTPASTWASPSTLLAVTDRRLLWLLDDAVGHRVRFLLFRDADGAEHRPMRLRRSRAQLRVRSRYGKPWTFTDLRPATAAAIAGHVRDGLPQRR